MFRIAHRSTPVIVASAVLGLLGAGLVLSYVRGIEANAGSSGAETTVLVARQAIPAGTPAASLADQVAATRVPARFARPAAVTDLASVRDKATVARIEAGETLAAHDFAAVGQTKGRLAIPTGKEAVAVAVTLDGGVARYPAPGDRVNAYATFKDGNGLTRRILAGVEVLATQPQGSTSVGRAAGPNTLIYLLAVTPDEAAQTVFSRELGSVWLTLVPDGQPVAPVAEVHGPEKGA